MCKGFIIAEPSNGRAEGEVSTREEILQHTPDPIRLDLDGEELQFRPASVRDLDPFIEWVEEKREPRELAVQVLQHQAVSDQDRDLVVGTSDEDLGRLLAGWAEGTGLEPWNCDSTDLEDVAAAFVEHVETQQARLQAVGEAMRETAESVRTSVAEAAKQLSTIASSDLAAQVDVLEEFRNAPRAVESIRRMGQRIAETIDLTEALRPLSRLILGRRRVKDTDLAFTLAVWWMAERPFLVKLGSLEFGDSESAEEAILAQTSTEGFVARLEGAINRTPWIRDRWPIIEPATRAHLEGQYALSVPVFMAQAEGILTDILVKRKLARLEPPDVRMTQSSGTFKGLQNKAEYWKKRARHSEFEPAADFICDRFSEDRNGVLHGTNISYARFEESARAFHVLAALAYLAVLVDESELET